MQIRSAKALGAAIRERRHALGLDQSRLARMMGASRQWIIAIEQGKDTAAIGLVLRTLAALDLVIDVGVEGEKPARRPAGKAASTIDIDQIVRRSRKPGRLLG